MNSPPSPNITLQIHAKGKYIPKLSQFKTWASAALPGKEKNKEITIRIVNKKESQKLNSSYRGKNCPTNILSFPLTSTALKFASPLLGDLVICAPIVKKEALEQNKTLEAHFAHLTIHGILHLLGYEHNTKKNAAAMEKLESKILHKLGFPNPYLVS